MLNLVNFIPAAHQHCHCENVLFSCAVESHLLNMTVTTFCLISCLAHWPCVQFSFIINMNSPYCFQPLSRWHTLVLLLLGKCLYGTKTPCITSELLTLKNEHDLVQQTYGKSRKFNELVVVLATDTDVLWELGVFSNLGELTYILNNVINILLANSSIFYTKFDQFQGNNKIKIIIIFFISYATIPDFIFSRTEHCTLYLY